METNNLNNVRGETYARGNEYSNQMDTGSPENVQNAMNNMPESQKMYLSPLFNDFKAFSKGSYMDFDDLAEYARSLGINLKSSEAKKELRRIYNKFKGSDPNNQSAGSKGLTFEEFQKLVKSMEFQDLVSQNQNVLGDPEGAGAKAISPSSSMKLLNICEYMMSVPDEEKNPEKDDPGSLAI
jgi:hypothetical protein